MHSSRAEREAEWLRLTRETLPSMATSDWPVDQDHCFQRICLDNAAEGVWYDAIDGRPAYRHASDDLLDRALNLARWIASGDANLKELNLRSLAWRAARKATKP